MKTQIEGFYSWYINLIKANRLSTDFYPTFIKSRNGMTTLDFTNYRKGLRKFRFAETFIERKVDGFKACVENLEKLPFERFSGYTDLDDFESMMCDFNNRYEWTGGQEPKDSAELISVDAVTSDTVVGQVSFTSSGRQDGTAIVTFKKAKNNWTVDNIELQ